MTDDRSLAATPSHLMQLFAERVSARDVDGLMALYEPEGAFQPKHGVVCIGHDQIRAALEEMMKVEPEIGYRGEHDVVVVGDVALVSGDWHMTGHSPDGKKIHEGGVSADVLRRHPDGHWLILIDQPRGVNMQQ